MEHLQRQPATQEAQPMVKESAPKPKPITKEALLLVEGNDSRNFFKAMCDHLSLGTYVRKCPRVQKPLQHYRFSRSLHGETEVKWLSSTQSLL